MINNNNIPASCFTFSQINQKSMLVDRNVFNSQSPYLTYPASCFVQNRHKGFVPGVFCFMNQLNHLLKIFFLKFVKIFFRISRKPHQNIKIFQTSRQGGLFFYLAIPIKFKNDFLVLFRNKFRIFQLLSVEGVTSFIIMKVSCSSHLK